MIETAIYIHIPFCDHKCIYCDFYSITPLDKKDDYLKALKKEIEFYSRSYSEEREIISIYFGGGTPSLMEPAYISEIIECVKSHFNVNPDAEITLETNPGTVNKSKMNEFKGIGINRVSVGIQSFNNAELKFLTRIHDASAAEKTIFYAYDAGIENINADLIFNLPGQNIEKWSRSLERAISLPVKHISAYSLILEPGTILNKMVLDGRVKVEGEDTDAELYEHTIELLARHGFEQYEVSNFALNGYECRHNNAYWHYKNYLGFGTSAHSFNGTKRWWNYTGLSFYLNNALTGGNAVAGSETLTAEQKREEYIMLALRSRGLIIQEFVSIFGGDWFEQNSSLIDELKQTGLLTEAGGVVKLTPKGYVICDEILARLA